MNITRHKRPDIGWITISQAVFQAGLSDSALGVLCYMLSLPDDWIVRTSQLQKKFNRGPDKMQSIIREIIGAGFILREPGKRVRGRWVSPKYSVADLPQPDSPGPVEPVTY
jgi:hypothetical protein